MLKTPKTKRPDPRDAQLQSVLASVSPARPVGRVTNGDGGMVEGAMLVADWNPEFNWAVERVEYGTHLELFGGSEENEDGSFAYHEGIVPEYAVVDTPAQFMNKYSPALEADDTDWCVFFVHIAKEPHNAGRGGGWRWHKWGEYIGDHEPQCEYLDDETGFDNGVYTANVCKVTA